MNKHWLKKYLSYWWAITFLLLYVCCRFRDKLVRKKLKKCQFSKFESFYFSSNFNTVFVRNIHLNGFLMAHYIMLFLLKKGSKREPNGEISHIWKVYRMFISHLILMYVVVEWITIKIWSYVKMNAIFVF